MRARSCVRSRRLWPALVVPAVVLATLMPASALAAPLTGPRATAWPQGVWTYEGFFKAKGSVNGKGGIFGPFKTYGAYIGPLAGGGSVMQLGGVGGSLGGTCAAFGSRIEVVDFFSAPNRNVSVAANGTFSIARSSNASNGRGTFRLKGRFSGPTGATLTGSVSVVQHQGAGYGTCRATGTFKAKRTTQVA